MRAVICPVGLSLGKKSTPEQIWQRINSRNSYTMGAERNTLRRLLHSPEEDKIYFITTTTPQTKRIANLLEKFYTQKGYLCEKFSVPGLVGNAKKLPEGLLNYVDIVSRIIENHSGDALIVATTSFKAVVAYNYILGSFYGVDVRYVYEDMKSTIKLPPLPINFDSDLWREYGWVIEEIIEARRRDLIKKLPPVLRNLFPYNKIGPFALAFYRVNKFRQVLELKIIKEKGKIINDFFNHSRIGSIEQRYPVRVSSDFIQNFLKELNEITLPEKDFLEEDRHWKRELFTEAVKNVEKFFHPEIKKILSNSSGGTLILRVDPHIASIPFEEMKIKGKSLRLIYNIGRKITTRESILPRQVSKRIKRRALIIFSNTGNLKFSEKEIKALKENLTNRKIEVKVITGKEGKKHIMDEIEKSDIVHYTGHSVIAGRDGFKSGWVITEEGFRRESGRITIKDIGSLKNPPSFIFSNSCSAADSTFLGGYFVLNGVDNYLSSLFPVMDKDAMKFSLKFYTKTIKEGKSIGEAIREIAGDKRIFSCYVLYGDPRNKIIG